MDLDDSLTTKKAGTLRDWQFQGVCPNGWVIPSEKDWNKLLEAVESANGNEGSGTSLKAVSSWDESETVSGGTNRFWL
jgi:Fibrobacter succinogenes major domain (Fib_succ_major).